MLNRKTLFQRMGVPDAALLEEYIRKHDYRFANEPKGEESKAPRWAIEMMVGKPHQKWISIR